MDGLVSLFSSVRRIFNVYRISICSTAILNPFVFYQAIGLVLRSELWKKCYVPLSGCGDLNFTWNSPTLSFCRWTSGHIGINGSMAAGRLLSHCTEKHCLGNFREPYETLNGKSNFVVIVETILVYYTYYDGILGIASRRYAQIKWSHLENISESFTSII